MVGIGVQFASGGTALTSSQQAGVVPIGNYNVLFNSSGTSSSLLNSSGSPTSLSLSYSASYTNPSYNGPYNTPDQILTSGGISVNNASNSDSVTLSNVPFSQYDLYVFVGPNNGNGDYPGNTYFQYSATDGSTTYYSDLPDSGFPGYRQAASTTPGTHTDAGDYILFSGETSSSLTFSVTPGNNGGTDMNGFEIIDTVPEPSTYAFMAGATTLLGTVAWRRKPGTIRSCSAS